MPLTAYVVQLLYPDYMTDEYGTDYYCTTIKLMVEPGKERDIPIVNKAIEAAQEEIYEQYQEDLNDKSDMKCFAVMYVKDGRIQFAY